MKPSEVYRRAAEMLHNGEADRSCLAVDAVVFSDEMPWVFYKSRERMDYCWLMLGGEENTHTLFGKDSDTERGKEIRILALLLMSEIAKDEERK